MESDGFIVFLLIYICIILGKFWLFGDNIFGL